MIDRPVRSVIKQAHRAYQAYLAEDYDGISAYAMVSMSRSSTSGALRARVSAGDVGSGVPALRGTKVVVFSYRGQLEILSLGANPTGATPTVGSITPYVPEPEEEAAVYTVFDDFDRASTFRNTGGTYEGGGILTSFLGIPTAVTNEVPWLAGAGPLSTDEYGQHIVGIDADGCLFARIDMFAEGHSSHMFLNTLEAFLTADFWEETLSESSKLESLYPTMRAGPVEFTTRIFVKKWIPRAFEASNPHLSGSTEIQLDLEWVDAAFDSGGYLQFRIEAVAGPFNVPDIQVDWDSNDGAFPGGPTTLTHGDEVKDNSWHTLKFQLDWPNHTFAAKLWADGDAEPDWMWEGTDYGGDNSTFFIDYVYLGFQGDAGSSEPLLESWEVKIDDLLKLV